MANPRPTLKELDRKIRAALQANPELLEFYLSLPDEQKQYSYMSLEDGDLPPEAIISMMQIIKDIEDSKSCDQLKSKI